MITSIPPLGFLIDLPLGLLMWTSLLHFMLVIFMPETSNFIGLRLLRGINVLVHMAVQRIAPNFVINRLLPLYAAFIIFILRYYVIPLLIGFDIWNFYDMPLEKLLVSAKSDLGF